MTDQPESESTADWIEETLKDPVVKAAYDAEMKSEAGAVERLEHALTLGAHDMHHDTCAIPVHALDAVDPECDCGLDAARAALEEVKGEIQKAHDTAYEQEQFRLVDTAKLRELERALNNDTDRIAKLDGENRTLKAKLAAAKAEVEEQRSNAEGWREASRRSTEDNLRLADELTRLLAAKELVEENERTLANKVVKLRAENEALKKAARELVMRLNGMSASRFEDVTLRAARQLSKLAQGGE